MTTSSIPDTSLADQASVTAQGYLRRAVEAVEETMGAGTAKEYPEIVAALIAASAKNYAASLHSHRIEPLLGQAVGAIERLADSLSSMGR
jgi:hypothetical protein